MVTPPSVAWKAQKRAEQRARAAAKATAKGAMPEGPPPRVVAQEELQQCVQADEPPQGVQELGKHLPSLANDILEKASAQIVAVLLEKATQALALASGIPPPLSSSASSSSSSQPLAIASAPLPTPIADMKTSVRPKAMPRAPAFPPPDALLSGSACRKTSVDPVAVYKADKTVLAMTGKRMSASRQEKKESESRPDPPLPPPPSDDDDDVVDAQEPQLPPWKIRRTVPFKASPATSTATMRVGANRVSAAECRACDGLRTPPGRPIASREQWDTARSKTARKVAKTSPETSAGNSEGSVVVDDTPPIGSLSISFCSHGDQTTVPCCTATFNVKELKDPESYSYRQHDGRHPKIQQCLIKGHTVAIKSLLKQVEEIVCEEHAKGVTNIRISFMCRQGRHRSVAVAELATAFLRNLGYMSKSEHLDLANRPCSVHGCRSCYGGPTPATLKMLFAAVR